MRQSRSRPGLRCATALGGLLGLIATVAPAQQPSFNSYGVPGLVDMPTAYSAKDATLSQTLAHVGGSTRGTLLFQITPRLSGVFRYGAIENFVHPDSVNGRYFDRSFDLRYQVLREGRYLPAVTVGLQDFVGTGIFSGEYVVASKEILPGLQVTGGLGWGRFGSYGAIGTTGTRSNVILGSGGVPSTDRWFRGDYAPFGGISYAPNDRLRFTVEYSSDNYVEERRSAGFSGTSNWNFGVDYMLRRGTQLSLYHTYGDTFGAQVTFFTDPKVSAVPGGLETAPQPVKPRDRTALADLGWAQDDGAREDVRAGLAAALAREGIILVGMTMDAGAATVRIQNPIYAEAAQAIGRTARVMTRALPGSVETFTIIPTENGIGLSAATMSRTDLERLENANSAEMLARVALTDAYGKVPAATPGQYPRFTWALAPDLIVAAFDPDNPFRYDLRAKLEASAQLAPNLVLSGQISQSIVGNIDETTRVSNSVIQRVRSDIEEYTRNGQFALDRLTLSHYGRPGPNLYSRVTLGYLEKMYAGVSGELLWKPVASRLALGVELNYVKQREFSQGFGLQAYEVATGHASAYYDFGNGFHGQLDVGRYLAGDYGATVSLDREFGNGWRVGAFATFTNVSFSDFGEGSFDKGIRLSIPFAALTGQSTRARRDVVIRPLTRDGGARLEVDGRLYESVRDYHKNDVTESWGKFWR